MATQCPRESLSIDDILPSEEDGQILHDHAVHYTMGFFVESFPSLSDLAQFVPAMEHLHPVTKSQVVPMKMQFHAEKGKGEQTIELLEISTLINDANLAGSPQVHKHTCIKLFPRPCKHFQKLV